jgi:hypothetical protein
MVTSSRRMNRVVPVELTSTMGGGFECPWSGFEGSG